jgi:type IV pilus assembly protein PilA
MTTGKRRGFTLIELLIVVVIIGILAAIAVPKFTSTKGRAYAASLKGDLRNLATAQEAYFFLHAAYSTDTLALNYKTTNGTQLTIVTATVGGWAAIATHPMSYPLTCALYSGLVTPPAPATAEGVVACQ